MKIQGVAQAREVCSYCPKLCRQACPAALAEGTEQATPTFKQQVALRAADGSRPLDPEHARVLYKCTDCRATTTSCRHRIDVGASLREARERAVEAGVAPPEIDWLRQRFADHGSPYALDLGQRAQPGRPRSGVTGVVPACTALVHAPDSLPRIMRLLSLTDASVTTALPEPVCCGYPLQAAGLHEAFLAHARRVASSLKGFERIAVQGASCAWTFSRRYAEVGVDLDPQVVPLVDLLAEHAPSWRRLANQGRPPDERRYAYHDPCFLARRLGRIEEPREVLRAATGHAPLELGYSGRDTLCSGGGGVYPLTHPDAARTCGRRVGDLFRETGADVLVTGCPSAKRRLRLAEPDLPLQSLAEVLEERLLGEGPRDGKS